MVKIRQHGADGALHDIKTFLPFLERRVMVVRWTMQVEWCLGENSDAIEASHDLSNEIGHQEFKNLYASIYQTVDGEFLARCREGSVRLKAVDSSYWEVESDIAGIEEAFLAEFGRYISPRGPAGTSPDSP